MSMSTSCGCATECGQPTRANGAARCRAARSARRRRPIEPAGAACESARRSSGVGVGAILPPGRQRAEPVQTAPASTSGSSAVSRSFPSRAVYRRARWPPSGSPVRPWAAVPRLRGPPRAPTAGWSGASAVAGTSAAGWRARGVCVVASALRRSPRQCHQGHQYARAHDEATRGPPHRLRKRRSCPASRL